MVLSARLFVIYPYFAGKTQIVTSLEPISRILLFMLICLTNLIYIHDHVSEPKAMVNFKRTIVWLKTKDGHQNGFGDWCQ